MYKKLSTLLLLFISLTLLGQNNIGHPKLVVGIVVDQMRWDYLYRYYDHYTNDGFKRLLNEGFSCENTMINYVPSYTAIGHSTIYTGSVPSIHGIAGNDFTIQATGQSMYCTQDDKVFSVGTADKNAKAGKMSPFNLKATTVTDELKLATNFRSKVIGVSIKDRGSILPAGHSADAAYWFDGESGNWITSTWYMQELPKWLTDFNNRKQTQKYLAQDWNTLYPINTYLQSTNDDNVYENTYEGQDKVTFPIPTSKLIKDNGLGLIRSTPYGNTLTLDVAKLALENEQLGQHPNTDFLAISLSSTDYVGHQFGINSVKTEDTYLRLDKDLGDFFNYLDQKIGKGNYTVFLTADHGGGHNGQFLNDNKIDGGNWDEEKIRTDLNAYLQKKFGKADMVRNLYNYQVNFNYSQITTDTDMDDLRDACITYLNTLPTTAYAVVTDKVSEASIPSVIKEKIINGYNRELCGEIQIILKPGWYSMSDMKGATHGAWNPYDAHIPLVWMGWGVKHGSSNSEVYMTDIAPTVAALLHIQMPSGTIGKPIVDLLHK
ncbi:alkaline phosphatase PafA [Dysgonomonas macrotermitis]|uniref:Type I phosphodiesterase / nucleotide pyrophosphatase n=1 Tax=Dysgonomonas macrotermitis TaxID=1346286 RepID=A0A1M5HB84_9BACT|nr:alkaline phosphatase PafA [Dysgonomonas macrotermitis]SHG13187.1 Type I phosphodiesterase / nucleotide pyrophosphatase [Dysgonomonas macrotermitis]